MESAEQKTTGKRKKTAFITVYVLVNVCRFLLALTFLFSAFTKANDPVGFVIKLKDYAAAIGFTYLPEYLLYLAGIVLTLVETILGIYLFVGVRRRRRVAGATTLFMMAMTIVTVWVAVDNPVSDCGCFGDALVLTNGQTLFKNIVLLAMAVFIVIKHKMMFRLVHKDWNWMVTVPVVVAMTALYSYCAYMLPLVDFLPFAEGTDLKTAVKTGDALDMRYKVSFIYTNGKDTLVLSDQDDDPDSTVWKYVETRSELLSDNLKATADLCVLDADGDDVTDDIIQTEGFTFLVTMPDITNAAEGSGGKFNSIYDFCQKFGYGFYFITNIAELQEKERWTRHTGAEYPFYECEDRTLWQIVRDNPGLVLIKDGVIIRKWSQFAMPEFDYEHELNPETIEELPHPLRFSAKPIRFDD